MLRSWKQFKLLWRILTTGTEILKIGDIKPFYVTGPVDLVCQLKKLVTQYIIYYLLKTL